MVLIKCLDFLKMFFQKDLYPYAAVTLSIPLYVIHKKIFLSVII